MKVTDEEPGVWFLLEDGEDLYLDAFCSYSFFDYTVLIQMNAKEIAAFRLKGREYLSKLAYAIHYSGPAVLKSRSPFKARNLTVLDGEPSARAQAAIEHWRNCQPD